MDGPLFIEGVVVGHFLTDSAVTSKIGRSVYEGNDYPKGTTFPAARLQFNNNTLAARGAVGPESGEAWTYTGQIDVHADDGATLADVGATIMDSLLRLEGATKDGVTVSRVQSWDVQKTEDASWTPPRKRMIVSVTLTARRETAT